MLDSRYSVLVIKGMCSSNDTRPSARQPRGYYGLRPSLVHFFWHNYCTSEVSKKLYTLLCQQM
jgi:hypothetical protein